MLWKRPINKAFLHPALSVSSGILGLLAFPPFKLAILAWFFLIPILFVVKKSNLKESFLYSYLTGLVFFGGVLYWLVNVSVPGAIILVLILSVYFGLFGCAANIVFKYKAEIFLLPFFWVALEYVRGYILTGFPWALLAYTQYKSMNIIQIADFTGAYGVSFIIVMFNVAFFAYVMRMERKVGYLMMALFFILMSMMYGTRKLDDFQVYGSPRLSVVQGNIPQNLKWDPREAAPILRKYTELTREAAKDSPDMIIWPETAYPYLITNKTTDVKDLKDLAAEISIPILVGAVAEKRGDYYNDAILFSEKGELAKKYEKLHLVPFGEYVPFGDKFSFIRNYIDKPIGDFKKGEEYTLFSVKSFSSSSSPKGTITRRTNFFKFGALICFEDIFPELSRGFVKRGANFLVNMTNDAWFGKTSAPEQHLQASVFRAVENRVPVIRAANTGVSCFVDSTGEILSRVEEGGEDLFVSGYATEKVRIPTKGSVYSKYGDLFIYFCGFMILLILAMEVFLVKRERSSS